MWRPVPIEPRPSGNADGRPQGSPLRNFVQLSRRRLLKNASEAPPQTDETVGDALVASRAIEPRPSGNADGRPQGSPLRNFVQLSRWRRLKNASVSSSHRPITALGKAPQYTSPSGACYVSTNGARPATSGAPSPRLQSSTKRPLPNAGFDLPKGRRHHGATDKAKVYEVILARPEGLEPSTVGLEGRCSVQLSYGRPDREDTCTPARAFMQQTRLSRCRAACACPKRTRAANSRATAKRSRLVGVERFELPTSCSQSRCAARLRHTPLPPIRDCRGNRDRRGCAIIHPRRTPWHHRPRSRRSSVPG